MIVDGLYQEKSAVCHINFKKLLVIN